MGVRTIVNHDDSMAVIYCSTTDIAFGPVIYNTKEWGAEEAAEDFLKWLKVDARTLTDVELRSRYNEWRESK